MSRKWTHLLMLTSPHGYSVWCHRILGSNEWFFSGRPNRQYFYQHQAVADSHKQECIALDLVFQLGPKTGDCVSVFLLFVWLINYPSFSMLCVSNLGGHRPEQSGPYTKFSLRAPHNLPCFAARCSGKQPELHSENLTQRSIRLLWLILTLSLGSGL